MTKEEKIQIALLLSLALLGFGITLVPLGIRFSGMLFMGVSFLWGMGLFLGRWARRSRWGRICRRVFLTGLAAGTALLIGIECAVLFYGEKDNSALPVDAVIVLGAGVNGERPSLVLQSRIDAAMDYLNRHPGIPAVLSGGQGPGEDITEAEAMLRGLELHPKRSAGLPLVLLKEEASTNTAENFAFSKALLEAYGLDTGTAVIAVVSSDFHCFRARMIARRLGLETVSVPAELPWWLTGNYYLREAFAVVKTALFD